MLEFHVDEVASKKNIFYKQSSLLNESSYRTDEFYKN